MFGILPVREASTAPTLARHPDDNVLGNGGRPACRQCMSSNRQCIPAFNVRFSTFRAWTPRKRHCGDRDPPSATEAGEDDDGPQISPTGNDTAQHVTPSCSSHDSPAAADSPIGRRGSPSESPRQVAAAHSDDRTGPTNVSRQGHRSPSPAPCVLPWALSAREAELLQYFGSDLGGPW